MKILKLHFKNLNSLVGEWSIDFTAAEYSAQGIFAITGPTGAGKSTILDAICLALYGRTPRLERINASQNEIMSRQSAECFASLEFQTSSGSYRTLWSQARARKKADGNLQNAQHIIEDCINNKTLEDKLSRTPQVVTDVTGMDFDHFTRAMLLAQGGFAKFLQSSADERSPILEKITGTEIYSQISKLVHERKTSEENILNNINATLAGITLLNATEIEDLQAELGTLSKQITLLMDDKSKLEHEQTWLTNLHKLSAELTTIEQSQQQLQLQQAAFVHDELRLKDAKLVEEISSDIYIQLQELRKQVTQIQQYLSLNQQQLPKLQGLLTTQQALFSNVHNELASYKITHAENLKTLQQVRLVDNDIVTKHDDLAKITSKLTMTRAELGKLQSEQQEFIKQQAYQQQQQIEVSQYLNEHQRDANLISSYSGICSELDKLQGVDSRIKLNQAEQVTIEDNLEQLTKQFTACVSKQTTYNEEHSGLKQQITQYEHNIQHVASGKTVAMLKDEILLLNGKSGDYRELLRLVQEKDSLALKLQQIATHLAAEQQSMSDIKPQLARESQLLDYTSQLLDNLTAQKLLQSKIISLSDERSNLQPNQPCPLCGGLEHPYAQDGVAVNNEIDSQIQQAKTKISQLQATLNKLNSQLTTNTAHIAKLTEQQQELIGSQEQLQQNIDNLAHKHTLNSHEISAVIIQDNLNTITTQLSELNEQIKLLQNYSEQLSAAELKQQQLDKQANEINLELTRLTEQKLASEKRLAELTHDSQQMNGAYEQLLQALTITLAEYQLPVISCDNLPAIKGNLAKLRDAWQNHTQQAQNISAELQRLAHQLAQNASLQQALDKQISEQQAEIAGLQQSINELAAKRSALFGTRDADSAQTQWQQELSALEEKAQLANDKLNQLMQQQTALQALIEKDSAQCQLLQLNQGQLEEQFTLRLATAAKIADEAEFISKRLSREEMAAIQQTADNLKQQSIELSSRHKQTHDTLTSEQAKQLTAKTMDELQAEINSIQTNYEQSNQRIGEIRGQLSANQQALEQQQGNIIKRDKQLQITERYRRLHVLIGSSDGKKFRNFAQGLTFELVVKHANLQLRHMSDRYLLIRDNDAPLELNVIDNYQGGEVRTTKNLSGGESFVISLALALGLSKLSSNKVQVDSLFLDEGFGTLDEDSLQTALDALDSLQRDGKLIGVISHVGALKERISLQIQVEPLSGGVSRISGVGCSWK